MSTISHEAQPGPSEPVRWQDRVIAREMWASLAISAMWFAVAVDALWGPDFVSVSGTNATRIPSAIVVAVFAYLGTRVLARYGFRRTPQSENA